MKKYILYSHGGSGNHGCEALARTVCKLLNKSRNKIVLLSMRPDEDIKYGLDELCQVKKMGDVSPVSRFSIPFMKAYLKMKLYKKYKLMDRLSEINAIGATSKDVAICIGGDSYCYDTDYPIWVDMHNLWKDNGLKTVYWGCSIEPGLLNNPIIANDIKRFDLITARESISYEALKKINANTIQIVDSAFLLQGKPCNLPDGFIENNTVGINVSPLSMGCGKNNVVMENYENLVRYVIEETTMSVCLIPHVIWEHDDDRKALEHLYEMFSNSGRVCLVTDRKAEELKYIISKCRFLVASRTHASIAAYSTFVPTLVVGYSVKSKGIAQDLFGTAKNYVIAAQDMKSSIDLRNHFLWIEQHENRITEHLKQFIPEYVKRLSTGVERMKKL